MSATSVTEGEGQQPRREWATERAAQMKDANRRLSKLDIALLFLVYYLALKKLFRVQSVTKVTLIGVVVAIIASLKPAPRRQPSSSKVVHLYKHYPIVGGIGWIRKTITECPVQLQLWEARKLNYQPAEVCLLGGTRDMYIFDKRDLEYVLRDNWRNFTKNVNGTQGFLDYFCEVLGRGIFAVDGDEWQAHRKTASYMFSNTALNEKMESSFSRHGEMLVQLLKKRQGDKINVQEVMQALTFDTISDVAFGMDPGAVESVLNHGKRIDFLVRFDRVQQNITLRFYMPAPVWRFLRLINVGFESEIAEDSKKLREYVQQIIDKRKAELADASSSSHASSKSDLLSLYIDTANKHPADKAHLKNDDYLSDMILNFQIAGRDTTSCTLTNLFLELANCPRAVQELRQEFDRVLGSDRHVSMDNIKDLRYACAVFNEVLRLHPPVLIDGRVCNEDSTLPSGVTVPKNTFVWIPNSAIGRDPKRWANPDAFLPERWLEGLGPQDAVRRVDEYLHPVFWGGPRVCIGKDAARLEVIVIAKCLLQEFDLVLADANNLRVAPAPVQFYEDGLFGYFKPREQGVSA